MKKIYLTLVVLAFLCAANATERMWIFANFGLSLPVDYSASPLSGPEIYTTVKTIPLDETSWTGTNCTSSCSQGLELCKNYKISTAAKPDQAGVYGSFGARFQLDGLTPAVVPPAIPVTSYLAFEVIGNATITLWCNPKDAAAKPMNVVNSSGAVVATGTTSAVSSGSNPYAELVTINYTGAATRLTIYPTYALNQNISCLYIYAIKVVDSPPTDIQENQVTAPLKKVGNQIQNEEAASVEIYTVLGAKVLASSETSIDIAGLASGVYIARTSTGSLKFIK